MENLLSNIDHFMDIYLTIYLLAGFAIGVLIKKTVKLFIAISLFSLVIGILYNFNYNFNNLNHTMGEVNLLLQKVTNYINLIYYSLDFPKIIAIIIGIFLGLLFF